MKKIILLCFLLFQITQNTFAQTVETFIVVPPNGRKYIKLDVLKLTDNHKKFLASHAKYLPKSSATIQNSSNLPKKAWVSMNIPVMDQGIHGTCATFAVTAALEGTLKQGEYISQLCNLALGLYLQKQGYLEDSGWDGADPNNILDQIKNHGIISIQTQKKHSCGSLYEYPSHVDYTSNPMSIAEFSKYSVPIMKNIMVKHILEIDEAFSNNRNSEQLLQKTKKLLVDGHRIVLSVALDPKYLVPGKLKNHLSEDSWLMTPEIINDIKYGNSLAGHAMVIMGYDDDAVIEGPNKIKQVGAFILRNSWGEVAGFHGHYYMSYDYFKIMAFELTSIRMLENTEGK